MKSSSLALAGAWTAPARSGTGAAPAPARKVLVVILQRGGADGLNIVVPFGDPAYAALRPTIAIPPPGAPGGGGGIDLDGFFALHPALEPLAGPWRAGRLAAVHAAGSPDPTRSHLDAQDYLESGTPGVKGTRDGWLGRYLAARPDPAATRPRAVSSTAALPRSLQGSAGAVAVAGLERTEIDRTDPGCPPAGGAEYPRGGLGDALRRIAGLIKADAGLEIACAETSGWDHHTNANLQLAPKLADLAGALAAFDRDLGSRMRDVVVLSMSEFGRSAAENRDGGTDHGHGGVLLVMGGPVRGGRVYGRWPGLGRERLHQGRDLAVTTDFRSVLAEVLVRHLGLPDAAPVFPGCATVAGRFAGVIA